MLLNYFTEEFLTKNEDAKKIKNTPHPWYEEVRELIEDKMNDIKRIVDKDEENNKGQKGEKGEVKSKEQQEEDLNSLFTVLRDCG